MEIICLPSLELQYLAWMAIGKLCSVCNTKIQRGEMIYIGKIHQKVFHQDCYEILEKHQALQGAKEKFGLTQDIFEEVLNGKKLIDYGINRK